MREPLRWRLVLLSAIVLLSGCGRSQRDSPSARVSQLFAEWNNAGGPGCAVAISRNRVIVYEGGHGMANIELGLPITPPPFLPSPPSRNPSQR